MSSITKSDGSFADFDDEQVYQDSRVHALKQTTRNFVVEFGKDEAQIAFDLESDDIDGLLKADRTTGRPVRWINIWAPNRQTKLVDLIGKHYKFSPRLLAIIQSKPPGLDEASRTEKHVKKPRAKLHQKDDLEVAVSGIELSQTEAIPRIRKSAIDTSHYTIAKQMVHYQSVDGGTRFLCLGANWMHKSPAIKNEDNSISSEGQQTQLWSWLVLCDDHTVISLHEDPGLDNDESHMKVIRANTISVLSQLSVLGHDSADPISMQTVRQTLELNVAGSEPGVEGASNLFYYLFDDWRAVYTTVAGFHTRLDELQSAIVGDIDRKSHKQANIEIIPRLHMLGRQIRQMEHLYKGYRNLISRILEQKHTNNNNHHGMTTPRSFTGLERQARGGVVIAQSALSRFERLGDRIQLLILSQTQEFLAEKEALISTYFNINAQKDSEATARLTRAATLLAKLSVLFLPVSLMTGYFSVQISDLQGVYTTKDYWYSFAVIMAISVLGLFFFAKSLMWVTETLDGKVTLVMGAVRRGVRRRIGERKGKGGGEDSDSD